ncbi:MAG: hypothetical protein JXB88_13145 [Spirochaetales bacterium]|nr:hypothetical protein [Spirochaetales bacterium]
MMQKIIIFFIILLFFTISILYADIHKGTAGSMSYYQSEISNKASNGNVGPDGSISYEYPMGIVNANYSSQTGRWKVGITSVISRDTRWRPPGYTDSDIFLLDGMELVYAEGTNPRIYHTRKESYARIEYWNPG